MNGYILFDDWVGGEQFLEGRKHGGYGQVVEVCFVDVWRLDGCVGGEGCCGCDEGVKRWDYGCETHLCYSFLGEWVNECGFVV